MSNTSVQYGSAQKKADLAGTALADEIQQALDDAKLAESPAAPALTPEELDDAIAAEADDVLSGDFATFDDVMRVASSPAATSAPDPGAIPADIEPEPPPEPEPVATPQHASPPSARGVEVTIEPADDAHDGHDAALVGHMQSIEELLDEETAEREPAPPEDSYEDIAPEASTTSTGGGSRRSIEATLDQMLADGDDALGTFEPPQDFDEAPAPAPPPATARPAPPAPAPKPVAASTAPATSPAPAPAPAPATKAPAPRRASILISVLAAINLPLRGLDDDLRNLIGLVGLATSLTGSCLIVYAIAGHHAAICVAVLGIPAIAWLASRLNPAPHAAPADESADESHDEHPARRAA